MMNRNSIYMKLNAIITMMSIFVLGLAPLRTLQAAQPSACQSTCDSYQYTVDHLKSDSTCQASGECRSCVDGITSNTQVAQYCMAARASKKASHAQIGSIVAYGAAAAVCTVACVFTWAGGDSVCTGSTIGAGVAEVGLVALLNKDSKNMAMNMFTAGLGGLGYAMGANMAGTAMNGAQIGNGSTRNNNQSCAAAGIMAALAIIKGINKKKMDVGSESNCKNIEDLASKNSQLTSCLGKFTPSNQGMSFATGYGTMSPPTDIDNNGPDGSLVVAGDSLADEIFKSAEKGMKPGFSVTDFKKRLGDGESLSKMLSGIAGSSNPGIENKFAALEKELATSMNGSVGSQVAGTGSTPHGKELSFSEIGFGNSDTGLSGTESELSISGNRKIASVTNDGDIFHRGYGGTIFQIVSQTLVNQKPNVQALEPALPLNRALAGLKNESPAAKIKAGKK